jgi:hypothetical protein
MRNDAPVKLLFWIAGLYDGILGLLFLVFPARLYETFGVPPTNHWGYVHFTAALLIVFAIMFFAIARQPLRNRNLIPYGLLLKVSYCGVVFWHWAAQGIPDMWKPFAVADVVFALLFIWAYARLGKSAQEVQPA